MPFDLTKITLLSPRAPTTTELAEIAAAVLEGDQEPSFLDGCGITVFDRYCTDCPGYRGKVAMIVWSGGPNMVSVVTEQNGKFVEACSGELDFSEPRPSQEMKESAQKLDSPEADGGFEPGV